jgi:hypothetical protein
MSVSLISIPSSYLPTYEVTKEGTLLGIVNARTYMQAVEIFGVPSGSSRSCSNVSKVGIFYSKYGVWVRKIKSGCDTKIKK